jgi:hypothetical protein
MTNAGITPTTFDARIVALRFFFGMTGLGAVVDKDELLCPLPHLAQRPSPAVPAPRITT